MKVLNGCLFFVLICGYKCSETRENDADCSHNNGQTQKSHWIEFNYTSTEVKSDQNKTSVKPRQRRKRGQKKNPENKNELDELFRGFDELLVLKNYFTGILENVKFKYSKIFPGFILSIPLPPPVNQIQGNLRDRKNSTNLEAHNGRLTCGFNLRNQFWITNETALMMVSNDQRLPPIKLPFRSFDGVCKTFGYGKSEKTWMCFAREGTNLCQSFNGSDFVTEAETSFNHSCTNSLGSHNGAPFITGSFANVKTEMFEPKFDRWTLTANFPFASNSITYYDTVSVSNSIYVLGGLSDGIASKVIARFKNGKWSKEGELLYARYGHRSLSNGADILIFGGFNFTPPPKSKEKNMLETIEVWNSNFTDGQISNFTLPNDAVTNGFFLSQY